MNEVEEANEKSSIWAEAYSDWTLKHGRGVQSGGKDEVEEAAEAIERQRLKVFLSLSLSLSRLLSFSFFLYLSPTPPFLSLHLAFSFFFSFRESAVQTRNAPTPKYHSGQLSPIASTPLHQLLSAPEALRSIYSTNLYPTLFYHYYYYPGVK